MTPSCSSSTSVESTLVEHRDIRAATACAFELRAHLVVEQPRTAHLVAELALGDPCLQPVGVGQHAGMRDRASEHGAGDSQGLLHLHPTFPLADDL